ncbi:copper homeostasis protein CutC [Spongiimicrobium sp. 3-5]|uniref:copper homeostasis protein CutC n=1 Tax=Spongiimicrobium sp. 3-5 TaxID=3332596 RepID=UPI0039803D21
MLVEVCANSLESACNAENAGADRIELCSELGVGGITPSYGLLKAVRKEISIPIRVLIRPRSGDFTYSESEFRIMQNDIALCADMGFEGVVSGILQHNFTLDVVRTQLLVALAKPMKFTFHRAFDWVQDPAATASQLEELGIANILTSGQQKNAMEGIALLSGLHATTAKTVIMPGGGIHENNVAVFKEKGFKAIHLSGTELVPTLNEKPTVSMNSPALLAEDAVLMTMENRIRRVVQLVK